MKKKSKAQMVNMIATIIGKSIQWCFTCLRIAAPPVKVVKPSNAMIVMGVYGRARIARKMKGNNSNTPRPTRIFPIVFL